MKDSADVIVIGGGVAGLCTARDLTRAGLQVILLEARDRLGGRILTRRVSYHPIELGAEFIHGRPPEIFDVIADAGLRVTPVAGEFVNKEHGQWTHSLLWEEVNDLFDHMPADQPDQSFAQYLRSSSSSSECKQHAINFVQGFHAADPEKLSVHWLIRATHAEEEIGGEQSFRLDDGYEALLRAIEAKIDGQRGTIGLQSPVKEVFWKRGDVRVRTASAEYHAPRAVITVPLAILKARTIRFHPPLAEKQPALDLLEMGPVLRLSLLFESKLWASRPELRRFSFIFTDEPDFSTWWTSNLFPLPLLTAWAGGPRAARLMESIPRSLMEGALESLARILDIPFEELSLKGPTSYSHDWTADPYSEEPTATPLSEGPTLSANSLGRSPRLSSSPAKPRIPAATTGPSTAPWPADHGSRERSSRSAAASGRVSADNGAASSTLPLTFPQKQSHSSTTMPLASATRIGLLCSVVLLQSVRPSNARLEDLAYARENYVSATHAFSPMARDQARKLIRDLEEHAGNLSDLDFLIGMQRVTALAANAHDDLRVSEGAWSPQARLPLRLIWFPDALIVARAGPPVADLAGARVIAIEGLAPDALFARLASLCGGNENYCRWNLPWAIEFQGTLHALGIATSSDQLQFNLVLPNGSKVERVIAMVPAKAVPGMRPGRLWSGELSAEETAAAWRAALDPKTEPLYLQDADEPFRLMEIPALNAWYLQFRVNRDFAGHRIRPFAREALAKITAHSRQILVVDLRFDVGGDITRTRDVMRELPSAVPGRVYLLVGRYTFSAGIVASAILKSSGKDKVTVVGEGLGDRMRWWSEGHDVCLPNSHICLSMTDGLWDLAKGCASEPACYGDRITGPVGALDPEIAAPLTAAAWLSERDPALEELSGQPSPKGPGK